MPPTLVLTREIHNKMKRISLCSLILSIALPLHSHAESIETSESDYFYIGGKVGWTYFGNGCESHNVECDRDALGAGAYLGYQFLPWLAVEGGYDYFGRAKAVYPALENSNVAAPYESKVHGAEISLKASYPITSKLSVFGKGGSLYWHADKTGREASYSVNSDDKDFSLTLGTGLDYEVSSNLTTRLEYQWFDNVGGENTGGSDIHWLTVSLQYQFKKPSLSPSPSVVEPESSPEPIIISDVEGKALFQFNDFSLTEHAKAQLEPIVSHLKANPSVDVKLIGHTDSKGASAYNQTLSELRAKQVAKYLTDSGVDEERISTTGQGESNPIASNETEFGREKNRRVEVFIPSFTTNN